MQFNDTVGGQGIVQDINFWAGTTDETFPLVDKVRRANRALDLVSQKILQNTWRWTFVDDNSTDFYTVYTICPAGEDNIALEVSHLVLERVRIRNKNGQWETIKPRSRREIPDYKLDASGQPTDYYRQGQSLLFAPVPDYAMEVELEFQKGLDYFTISDTIKAPGFNPQFHGLISLYVARDYCAINAPERYTAINNEIVRLEDELVKFYQGRIRDEIPTITLAKSNRNAGAWQNG